MISLFNKRTANLELREGSRRKSGLSGLGPLLFVVVLGPTVHFAPASAAERVTVSARPDVEVAVEGDLLTVTAGSASVTDVLLAVGTTLGFETIVYGSLPDTRTKWSLIGLTPRQVVRRLVSDYDNVTLHSVSDPGRLSRVEVYAEPQASPVPPMAWRQDSQNTIEPSETLSEIEQLEASLGDPDPAVQMDAISSLGALGTDRAVQILGQVLFGDPHPEARVMAVEALARQAQAEKGAAKAFLTSAAKDADDFVREAAIRALGQLSE
jgi:hypothetical protein